MMKLILAFLAGFLFCTATIALDDLMYEWGEYQRPGSGYFTREAENGIILLSTGGPDGVQDLVPHGSTGVYPIPQQVLHRASLSSAL